MGNQNQPFLGFDINGNSLVRAQIGIQQCHLQHGPMVVSADSERWIDRLSI